MRGLIPRFSAERMLREYVEKLYTPQPRGPALDARAAAVPLLALARLSLLVSRAPGTP